MSKACPKCGKQITDVAKFCKYCSAAVEDDGSAMVKSASRYCEQCGTQIAANAEFCKRCGAAVAQPVQAAPDRPAKPRDLPPRELAPKARPIDWESDREAKRSELPPRELLRPERKSQEEPSAATANYGSTLAIIGALVAIAGCFLPLEASSGMSVTIVPALVKQTNYALVVPLSALALVFMARGAAAAGAETRVTLGGAVIALGSPWAVFWILAILAAARAISSLGWLANGAGIGIGAIVLALGFVAAVVGGFVILRETVAG